ncbi:MAG TPA: universal stress protein [Nitrospiraceae bacterium]|nr:universal stress protein [Nitrospiraceae bacterium]
MSAGATGLAVSKILLATDGSASAKEAESFALMMAAAYDARLDALSVLEFEPERDLEYEVNRLYLEDRRREIREQGAALIQRAEAAGVKIERHESIGIPSREIIALAERSRHDLVVVGTHGRTGFEHVLIGSTAERVVRGAPCPVATVRGARAAGREPSAARKTETGKGLNTLLVAVDFSDCGRSAVEYAVQLADRFGSEVTLLHVAEPVAYGLDFTLGHALTGQAFRKQCEESMAQLAGLFAGRGLSARHEVRSGIPGDVIRLVAHERGSDAIVMGTHGRRGWSQLRFGSVAEAVIRYADCPVLTVRSPKFRSQS